MGLELTATDRKSDSIIFLYSKYKVVWITWTNSVSVSLDRAQ